MAIDKSHEECEIWGTSLHQDLRIMQMDENQLNEYEEAHPEKRKEVPGAIPHHQTRAVKRNIREYAAKKGYEQYEEALKKAHEKANFPRW